VWVYTASMLSGYRCQIAYHSPSACYSFQLSNPSKSISAILVAGFGLEMPLPQNVSTGRNKQSKFSNLLGLPINVSHYFMEPWIVSLLYMFQCANMPKVQVMICVGCEVSRS
jgi:hypothetical protein